MNKNITMLIILDGFGYSTTKKYNAIAQANTPHLSAWMKEYPHCLLHASGTAVGLPEGFIGNSEVGHHTIGAGAIIKQPLTIIHESINDKSFFENKALVQALKKLPYNKTLHIIGLLSDAGIHSHIKHLDAYIQAAKQHHIKNIVLHLFLDGRDVAPISAEKFLKNIPAGVTIGSIQGRFYAMDRDKNWDRTQKSIDVLIKKQDPQFSNWKDALHHYYKEGITDEFIPPTILASKAFIKNGDGIIFFNFRPDRAQQLTQKLRQIINPTFFITPIDYGNKLKTTPLFAIPNTPHTLKEQLTKEGKTIFSIAETEKYAHVTYFFGGGTSKFPGETQILIPSISAHSYAEYPKMSAQLITDTVINSLETNPRDFYLINYANADMVGHSGDLKATIQAIEFLDHELGRIYEVLITKLNGTLYITADHGKAEDMFDEETNQPKPSHTTNPVPFIMIRQNLKNSGRQLALKGLSDIAGFILQNK